MNIEIKSVKIKDSKPLVIYFPLDENGDHQAELTYDKGPKIIGFLKVMVSLPESLTVQRPQ
jgi:hypothetical protein